MTLTFEDVVERAHADDIRLVRFGYCDPAGIIRAKNVHVSRLASRMREGIGMTRAQNTLNMLDRLSPLVEGMEPVGEIRITPDPGTWSVLPWVPRTAGMLSDQLGHDGLDWGCCPRSYLKRVIGQAADEGIMVQASFENEFYLFEEQEYGEVVPWQDGPCYSSAGLDRAAAVMGDIVDALIAQGIEVEQAINEYGPGQQEIAVRYRDALGAADQQLKFRDTVRGVAETMHGLIASFAPKPMAGAAGSGAHVHFSLWSTDGARNLMHDPDAGDRLLSELGRSFVAGVMLHLPALVALTCPSYNSYDRFQPHSWAGSTVSGARQPGGLGAGRLDLPGQGGRVDQRRAQGMRPVVQPVPGAGRHHHGRPRRRATQPPAPGARAPRPATLAGEEARRAGVRPCPPRCARRSRRSSVTTCSWLPRRPARAMHHRGAHVRGRGVRCHGPGGRPPGAPAGVLSRIASGRRPRADPDHTEDEMPQVVDLTQPLHPGLIMARVLGQRSRSSSTSSRTASTADGCRSRSTRGRTSMRPVTWWRAPRSCTRWTPRPSSVPPRSSISATRWATTPTRCSRSPRSRPSSGPTARSPRAGSSSSGRAGRSATRTRSAMPASPATCASRPSARRPPGSSSSDAAWWAWASTRSASTRARHPTSWSTAR
ncbi:MAG: glutamine synthetase family protein [Chloroflexota bacterium]